MWRCRSGAAGLCRTWRAAVCKKQQLQTLYLSACSPGMHAWDTKEIGNGRVSTRRLGRHEQQTDNGQHVCGLAVFCTLKLIKARAIEVLLTSMARHADDATVQNYGLGVLRNISFLRMSCVAGWHTTFSLYCMWRVGFSTAIYKFALEYVVVCPVYLVN